jgi:hypothetical protein
VHHTELLTEDSVPEGKNRGHMLSAVALSKAAQIGPETKDSPPLSF